MAATIKPPTGKKLETVRNLCLLGYTNAELAVFIGVSEKTVLRWLSAKEKQRGFAFGEAVRESRDQADGNVAASLYKRACGYTITEQKALQVDGRLEVVTLEKEIPADTSAANKWLAIRQRDRWRETAELNVDVTVSVDPSKWIAEVQKRFGPVVAKQIAQQHGFTGLLIEGEAEEITEAR